MFRCERLEEQLNDLTELHQNEILNLKQELASMEEKIAYQSYERARDIQVCVRPPSTSTKPMSEINKKSHHSDQVGYSGPFFLPSHCPILKSGISDMKPVLHMNCQEKAIRKKSLKS